MVVTTVSYCSGNLFSQSWTFCNCYNNDEFLCVRSCGTCTKHIETVILDLPKMRVIIDKPYVLKKFQPVSSRVKCTDAILIGNLKWMRDKMKGNRGNDLFVTNDTWELYCRTHQHRKKTKWIIHEKDQSKAAFSFIFCVIIQIATPVTAEDR